MPSERRIVSAPSAAPSIAIAAGTYHSLALASNGTVWAWGYNASGQLGNGTTKNSLVPVQVKNIAKATGVAAGAYHSLAVASDGTVWSWGYNADGELGNGTTTNSTTPVKVTGLSGVSTISAGDFTSYALGTDGSVSDWGYGGDGELGNGNTSNTTTPTQPTGLGKPTSVTYSYDGDGLRASITNAGATKHFVWDVSSDLPLLLTDGSTNYLYDDNGTPVEQIDVNATPLYYQHDQLGSTRLLTDQNGNSAATYTFDAYGNLTNKTGVADTPLRWNGQYQDQATGFYYLRTRYYDPATDQLLTVDRGGNIMGQPYAYAGGDPINAADPGGLYTVGVCTGANAVLGGIIAVQAEGCLTRTRSAPSDQIGVVGTAGGGAGAGADIGAGLYYSVSNANTLAELTGPFYYASVGGQLGGGASVLVYWNSDLSVYGISFGPAYGAGAYASVGATDTWAHKFGGLKAWAAKGAWDLLAPTFPLAHYLQIAYRDVLAAIRHERRRPASLCP